MSSWHEVMSRPFWVGMGAAAILVVGYPGTSSAVDITLSGSQEVPPVTTSASGKGTITVGDDKAVSGSVITTGVEGTAAHIHQAAPGQNGPVIVPLTKSGNTYTVPAGAKLTDDQYAAYKAGNLYVNVHSAANKGGEIRGQIKP
jgi:CHRD domain